MDIEDQADLSSSSPSGPRDDNFTPSRDFKQVSRDPTTFEVAQRQGASYFDLGDRWHTISATERVAANQHFLDVIIGRREVVRLAIPRWRCRPDSWTAAEIRYLESNGYRWSDDFTLTPTTERA